MLDRDLFIQIFQDIYNFEDVIDNGFENEECKIWRWEDETFILEKRTGIIVSWYKHLGRANWSNEGLTTGNYEEFAKRILMYLNDGD